jgi:hypothetical protein
MSNVQDIALSALNRTIVEIQDDFNLINNILKRGIRLDISSIASYFPFREHLPELTEFPPKEAGLWKCMNSSLFSGKGKFPGQRGLIKRLTKSNIEIYNASLSRLNPNKCNWDLKITFFTDKRTNYKNDLMILVMEEDIEKTECKLTGANNRKIPRYAFEESTCH